MKPYWQAVLGCLVAAGGVVWAARLVTNNFTSVQTIQIPPGGPMEVAALGVVIWLHAKFRMHTSVDKH